MSSILTKLTHKQLFLTDFTIKDKEILIENQDLLNQVRKVLRLEKSDVIYVQKDGIRYEVGIKDRDDKTLTGTVASLTPQPPSKGGLKGMVIGMPNKREKVELIVQKLTEIGIDEIVFWPSERSVIKVWNEKKVERLMKIAREAVEQSWGRRMPHISFLKNISDFVKNKKIIVFDKKNNETWRSQIASRLPHFARSDGQQGRDQWGLVGPEGGLTERDYEALKGVEYEVRELGEMMLRTETAAIVGGWLVKNLSL